MVGAMFNKLYDKVKKFIKENWSFLLGIVVIFCFFYVELPFVVYRPGGIVDLSSRVEVENGYEGEGSLSMSYVSMMKGNIPFVLLSFVLPNWDLVETKQITYENESLEETIETDKIFLEEGLDNATISAYKLAGKEITIKGVYPVVVYIDERANTDLQLGDIVLSTDGKNINVLADLQTYINSLDKDATVSMQVLRDDKEITCTAKLFELDGSLKVGVSIANKYEYVTNPKLTIETKESESGSSGGLMTALSIYNALVEEDITKGKKIVGTGTIDSEGVVGEIGGIKYKLLGAEKNHADIFLCPIDNYEEAKEVKDKNHLKLNLIPVKTLQEAVEVLKNAS